MSMDVTGIFSLRRETIPPTVSPIGGTSTIENTQPQTRIGTDPVFRNQISQNVQELEGITKFLNRKIKFSFNEELQQVIVKILDGETDKVIKVIPPEELQRLHLRVRETLGILFDQLI